MKTRTRAGVAALALTSIVGLSACKADVTVVGGSDASTAAPTPQSTDGSAPTAGTDDGGSTEGGDTDGEAAPTPRDTKVDFPKTEPSPGDLKGKVVANDEGRKVVPDTTLPVFAPDPSTADEDGMLPNTEWPDAQQLFSVKELKHVFPDARSISIRNCLPTKDYSSNSLTAHNATCDIVVKMPDDDYSTSQITVTIEDVGTQEAMLADFDDYRKVDRKTTKKLDNEQQVFYYEDGSFGTQRYTNAFSSAEVVIGNGETAMKVELDVRGFNNLDGDDDFEFEANKETPSETIFRERIMPLLLQLLAHRM